MYTSVRFTYRWLLAALLLTLLLAACGVRSAPPSTSAPAASPSPPVSASDTGVSALPPTPTILPPTSVPATAEPASTSTPATIIWPATATPLITAIPPSTAIPAPREDPASPTPAPGIGSEILFLRNSSLMAYAPASGQEREIAPDVREFAATPDGRTLALVRGAGATTELWLVARSGSELRQVTTNNQMEGSLSWAPDGQTLAYAAASVARQRPLDWANWTEWCSASEVRLLDIASGSETTLAAGCDPAFSNDGQRIAFATPPENLNPAGGTPATDNTIRLVNRQGENGWTFASASSSDTNDNDGLLVYAPAWSPNSQQLAYQRFIGYWALVDINYTEMGDSFQGNGKMLNVGAGWLLPPLFSPDGNRMAVVEHNFSDARGFGGYEQWKTRLMRLNEQEEVMLPSGPQTAYASVAADLPRSTAAAWSPDGSTLVVALPTGWSADAPANTPLFVEPNPGNLWRWTPGAAPDTLLVQNVDFASPLLWLPAVP